MKISQTGLNLIAKWEGCYLKAYLDPIGIPTIGYGTTKYENGVKVKLGDTITKERALALLQLQAQEHANTIFSYVKVELNQNQYDALASFQYNLGRHILKNSSLLAYINLKQWQKAANEMKLYNKAGGKVLQGLVNRRAEEASLFLKESNTSTQTSHIGVLTLKADMNLREKPDITSKIIKVLPKGSAWKVHSVKEDRYYGLGSGWVSNPNQKYGTYKKN